MAAADRPTPTEIKLHQKSRVLEVSFSDGNRFELSYEFLRVYSPSAEVRGHGPGQEVLQVGKKDVDILSLEPVGSYAVQPLLGVPLRSGHESSISLADLSQAARGSRGAPRRLSARDEHV